MLVYRSPVAAAVFAGALLAGCSDPDLPTDLRKNGPPSVTSVMVMTDQKSARLLEEATYCRLDDDKRPMLVGLPTGTTTQVCFDDLNAKADLDSVAPGAPPAWYARIVFDMLLDPNIEDLVTSGKTTTGTLANTQPVTLQCGGVDVPYDGYYTPNGNGVSWPPGPSLFIQPTNLLTIVTGADCQVTVKDVVKNKAGNSVPDDQRGPYKFKVAPMAFRVSTPSPVTDLTKVARIAPDTAVNFAFSAAVKVPTGCNLVAPTVAACPVQSGVANLTANPANVVITSTPNLPASNNPSGVTDTTLCDGTNAGTAVPSGNIHATVSLPPKGFGATDDGTDADKLPRIAITSALVMSLDAQGALATRWAPTTTYLIKFGPNASVSATQGGPDAMFPSDFKLCFSTTVAP